MALINCPECGGQISDSVDKCIHCGYPMNKKTGLVANPSNRSIYIVSIVIIVVAAIMIGIIIGASHRPVKKSDGVLSTQSSVSNGFEEDEVSVTTFSRNFKITAGKCEFTLTGYSIDSKIEPSNFLGSYYHYYEASSGNVFIDVKFLIKNTASAAMAQADVLRSVKVIYDGTYEYNCTFVTVDKDGDFEGFTRLHGINPLETMEYHMLAEAPLEIKSSGKSLVCRVEVDGEIYECVLR